MSFPPLGREGGEGREEGEEKRGKGICVEISRVVGFSSFTEEMGKPKSRRGMEFPKAVLRLAKLSWKPDLSETKLWAYSHRTMLPPNNKQYHSLNLPVSILLKVLHE